ncbi:MAG: deoxyribodipyrimidine photo-lyase [Bacteroidales bacterium]|jgi:deoxyribodipyrimidine photo-lyase|nr:deoxyribodipyrimidine photo-lyase [Bacteroidales bacterium]
MKINIFWFRRDLRLEDNTALNRALNAGLPVMPLFIFDTNITDELPPDDPRIAFIYQTLTLINKELGSTGISVRILKGDPGKIWAGLVQSHDINAVYANRDYEPYAIERDRKIEALLKMHKIDFLRFKDQVIFEGGEILKSDGKPYTVFTPYKNKWLQKFKEVLPELIPSPKAIHKTSYVSAEEFSSVSDPGFRSTSIKVRHFDLSVIPEYHKYRNDPFEDKTSYLSPHLRFGTVSIRKIAGIAHRQNQTFLDELIWREFFMQILFHFPYVVTGNFKPVYDDISWRNNDNEFERWCRGETGYAIVDAGMRQLNQTGYMHNRVRMITAGFLCKHLLIDWRWGEAYFARKLLDYELSSNNGNWQWAAGTGCDAAPYFRIFNPETQQKKFDPGMNYIKKWLGNTTAVLPVKIVEHEFARQRALSAYKSGMKYSLAKKSRQC